MAAKKREVSIVKEKKQETKEKYLRRADVESLLEAQDQEAQTSTKKRKLEASNISGTPAEAVEDVKETEQQQLYESESVLSWPDLRRRLRELGEPIHLFGESLSDRMNRLRRVEMDVVIKHDEELEAGHGIRNRFVNGDLGMHGDAKDSAEDAAEDAEEFEATTDRTTHHGTNHTTNTSEDTSHEDDAKDADKMVYRFFKRMLQEWENDLATRPDYVKRTAQGKVAVKTMKQCKDYIRPLFKLCKHRQVPPDILPKLVDIVTFCRQGEFVLANDAYIKLAIGNAAWPIGVTMVGIHERSGREKIHSNKQAHVMNNESQRKYLTSVKRLMSYAQSISNVMPSKRVL